MKFPKRTDYIESIEYNGEMYTSVNEDAWLYALRIYNRNKNRLDMRNESVVAKRNKWLLKFKEEKIFSDESIACVPENSLNLQCPTRSSPLFIFWLSQSK